MLRILGHLFNQIPGLLIATAFVLMFGAAPEDWLAEKLRSYFDAPPDWLISSEIRWIAVALVLVIFLWRAEKILHRRSVQLSVNKDPELFGEPDTGDRHLWAHTATIKNNGYEDIEANVLVKVHAAWSSFGDRIANLPLNLRPWNQIKEGRNQPFNLRLRESKKIVVGFSYSLSGETNWVEFVNGDSYFKVPLEPHVTRWIVVRISAFGGGMPANATGVFILQGHRLKFRPRRFYEVITKSFTVTRCVYFLRRFVVTPFRRTSERITQWRERRRAAAIQRIIDEDPTPKKSLAEAAREIWSKTKDTPVFGLALEAGTEREDILLWYGIEIAKRVKVFGIDPQDARISQVGFKYRRLLNEKSDLVARENHPPHRIWRFLYVHSDALPAAYNAIAAMGEAVPRAAEPERIKEEQKGKASSLSRGYLKAEIEKMLMTTVQIHNLLVRDCSYTRNAASDLLQSWEKKVGGQNALQDMSSQLKDIRSKIRKHWDEISQLVESDLAIAPELRPIVSEKSTSNPGVDDSIKTFVADLDELAKFPGINAKQFLHRSFIPLRDYLIEYGEWIGKSASNATLKERTLRALLD